MWWVEWKVLTAILRMNAEIEFHKNGVAIDEKWIFLRVDEWWNDVVELIEKEREYVAMTLKIESTYETALMTNHIATVMSILQRANYFWLSWSEGHWSWIKHMFDELDHCLLTLCYLLL